jgi:hypothetical protein
VNGYGSQTAAGWAKAFSGTNKAAYRPPVGGNRFYLRVQDDGGGTGGAKEALIRSFETMSDVDTGTNGMPTSSQSTLTSSSLVVRKSALADAVTGRPWIVAADDRTVYMWIANGDAATMYSGWGWGDFYSAKANDGYRTFLIGRSTENATGNTGENLDKTNDQINQTVAGHFIQRKYDASGTAVTMWKGPCPMIGGLSGVLVIGNMGQMAYPNPADGSLYLLPLFLNETVAASIRGRLRGLWACMNAPANLNDGDTFSGTGDLSGRTFRIVKQSYGGGLYVVETSDTWDTSS